MELTQLQPQDQDSTLSQTLNPIYTKALITTETDCQMVIEQIQQCENSIIGFDTETNGTFDRFKVQLVGISFGFDFGGRQIAYYLPFNHLEGDQLPHHCLDWLKEEVFENASTAKVAHNAKFDQMVMSRYDIAIKGAYYDTFAMTWLLKEEAEKGTRGLKPLVKKHLGVDMETYQEVIESAPKKKGVARDFNFARVPLENAISYAADDAHYCLELFKVLKADLEAENLWNAFHYVESPITSVVSKMEANGTYIDKEAISYADTQLPNIMDGLAAKIYEAAGQTFNINSGAQLGHILYEKLGIGTKGRIPLTKGKKPSTAAKTLELYATKHEIVNNVLRYKKVKKTHGTFVKGIERFIAQDGRVHTSFNPYGTVTGRFSSNQPNLQNIEVDEVEKVKCRSFFTAPEGHKLIVADFSQIELRVMAHFSKDENMINAFLSGYDFHQATAENVSRIMGETITRHKVKPLNFGVPYGRGANTIAEQMGISFKEAEEFIDAWFAAFPRLRDFRKFIIAKATEDGYVRTLTGRKRRLLPEIRSETTWIRNHAQRQAFNTKCQGSAADIIKMAMISLHHEFEVNLSHLGAQIILQVHDELVLECPDETAEEALQTTKYVMENPHNGKNPLILPLLTEPTIVDRWSDAK